MKKNIHLDTIDSQIKQFEKYKTIYPNVANFWIEHLNFQKQYINAILSQSDNALQSITSLKKDIPLHIISLLNCVINQPKDNT